MPPPVYWLAGVRHRADAWTLVFPRMRRHVVRTSDRAPLRRDMRQTLLEGRASLESDRPGIGSSPGRLLWPSLISLQRIPAALCRPSDHARAIPPRRFGARRPTSSSVCVLAVFSPCSVRGPVIRRNVLHGPVRRIRHARGLSQPGRDLHRADTPGIFPAQFFSGPRVSAPYRRLASAVASRWRRTRHTYLAARSDVADRALCACDLAGFGPADKLC
jgi:hypothetical protein